MSTVISLILLPMFPPFVWDKKNEGKVVIAHRDSFSPLHALQMTRKYQSLTAIRRLTIAPIADTIRLNESLPLITLKTKQRAQHRPKIKFTGCLIMVIAPLVLILRLQCRDCHVKRFVDWLSG
jgi:hypothetical protein